MGFSVIGRKQVNILSADKLYYPSTTRSGVLLTDFHVDSFRALIGRFPCFLAHKLSSTYQEEQGYISYSSKHVLEWVIGFYNL